MTGGDVMNRKSDISPARYLKSRAATLLKLIAQGEEDVLKGKLTDQDSLLDRIETRLKARKAGKQAEK